MAALRAEPTCNDIPWTPSMSRCNEEAEQHRSRQKMRQVQKFWYFKYLEFALQCNIRLPTQGHGMTRSCMIRYRVLRSWVFHCEESEFHPPLTARGGLTYGPISVLSWRLKISTPSNSSINFTECLTALEALAFCLSSEFHKAHGYSQVLLWSRLGKYSGVRSAKLFAILPLIPLTPYKLASPATSHQYNWPVLATLE